MNELWVARDGRGVRVYDGKPQWFETLREFYCAGVCRAVGWMKSELFPDLLPGQCRRLVMESEASE
jgi:hypothetical protein